MSLINGLISNINKIIHCIRVITLDELVKNVIFSLLAAFIFWIVFNFIPDWKRQKRIRPKVEFDIYEFYQDLFYYIQIPFKLSEHISPTSLIQSEIYAGKITKEDFEKWLQNKCLNESYLYDDMATKYLCIGERFEELSTSMCEKAKNIYMFTNFLSANEILLIKKIITKIRVYSYGGDSGIIIGGEIFKPVNPNLAYMANNMFEIYEMFLKLQQIVLSFKYIDISINTKIAWNYKWRDTYNAYYRGEYKKCLRRLWLAEIQKKSSEHTWSIKFQSLYRLGKVTEALTFLETQLKINPLQLISIRNSFDDFYMNEDVKRILVKARGEKEYIEMVECLKQEKSVIDQMISQSEIIKQYYAKKQSA
ncbi:hypothetical protein [Lacrimispora sp.]|uniref:hypothetical protein n=1 Tax=Lacrimispora sp. TaxID=2719234 RepID=UPI0032E42AC9